MEAISRHRYLLFPATLSSAKRYISGMTAMRTLRVTVIVALSLLPCASCVTAQTAEPAGSPVTDARSLATEYLTLYRARFPESDPANSSDIFDNSVRAYAEWNRRESSFLERLRLVMPKLEGASPEAVTLALLRERLEMSRAFLVCRRELWNVGPITSWLAEYRRYAANQPVGTDAAREAAARRWGQLPAFIDTEIVNLRAGARSGYTAPRMLVVAAIAQLDQLLRLSPVESPFYSPAARDTSTNFRLAFEVLVRDSITPALRRYRDYLADEYSTNARLSVGLSGLPDGEACFRALVRRYTTLDMPVADLRTKGRELLAATDAQAIRIRHLQLLGDSGSRFHTSAEALETMRDALNRAGAAAPRWFNRLPSVLVPTVDSMPDAEAADPEAIYVPAGEGEQPRVYVNVPRLMEEGGRLYAERLAFHEGIPGHHFQIALQRSADTHPLNRVLWNSGFGEGWAVYASNLADEMGLYSSDLTRFGVEKAKVDDGLTFIVQHGLHVLGWTRRQAVDTLVKYSGSWEDEAAQQVDYFIAAPAHALSYPIGARYIEDLRRDASRRLHVRFDVRRFHDVILESGALPLAVLRERVNGWIRSEQQHEPR